MSPRRLCRAEDVPEGGGRGFAFGEDVERSAVFVIRWQGALHAYWNICPHAGTPLDWVPDRFFDVTGTQLFCVTHGARFAPADGACLGGPCFGQGLTPAEIRVEDGEIYLDEA